MKNRKVKAIEKSRAFVSKKKLKGNLSLDTKSDSEADVNSDDLLYDERNARDDELSTDDEDLIQRQEDSSSEEEVLPITDDEKDDMEDEDEGDLNEDEGDLNEYEGDLNENESDVSEDEDEDSEEDEEKGLPSKDSWGKKKSIYFNADFVDQDRGKSYREKDAEQARAEEEEALSMQRNFLGIFTNVDQEIQETDATTVTTDLEKEDLEKENWQSLDKEGKLKYLKKKYPEMLIFINEFKEKLTEIKDRLVPLLELVKNGKIQSGTGANYIIMRYQLLLHYCTNLSFYMVLKSKGSVTDNHPVLQRIHTFKTFIVQMDSLSENANKEIDIILEKLKKNEEVLFKQPVDNESLQTKRRKTRDENFNGKSLLYLVNEDRMNFDSDIETELTDEKRTITYEMAKNKGLVAQRKKEIKNPRVRHRMKFRKAKIRRKGQVRQVIKEVKRYDGEPTGISTHVVRSIKMK